MDNSEVVCNFTAKSECGNEWFQKFPRPFLVVMWLQKFPKPFEVTHFWNHWCLINVTSEISEAISSYTHKIFSMRPAFIFLIWVTNVHTVSSETINALVLVRSCRLLLTKKIINPFPVIVRMERIQPRIQNHLVFGA